jgi:hypothetical protein
MAVSLRGSARVGSPTDAVLTFRFVVGLLEGDGVAGVGVRLEFGVACGWPVDRCVETFMLIIGTAEATLPGMRRGCEAAGGSGAGGGVASSRNGFASGSISPAGMGVEKSPSQPQVGSPLPHVWPHRRQVSNSRSATFSLTIARPKGAKGFRRQQQAPWPQQPPLTLPQVGSHEIS